MKSVGETMAIGRTFQESFQKALRSIETDLDGFNNIKIPGYKKNGDRSSISAAITRPCPERILYVAQAFREGFSIEEVHEHSKIDPWFLEQIKEIIDIEDSIKASGGTQ